MIIQSEIDPRLPVHANGNISVEIRHNIDDENSEETNCIAQLVRKDESPAPNLQARELTLPKNSKQIEGPRLQGYLLQRDALYDCQYLRNH